MCVCVCVCGVCPQLSSTSSWLGVGNVLCAAKSTQASLDLCMLSPGRRMMAPLGISQARSPAEGLQPSQGNQSAHRMGNDRYLFPPIGGTRDPYGQCLVKVKVWCVCVCVCVSV